MMAFTECSLVSLISKAGFTAVRPDDYCGEVVEQEESRDDEDVDYGLNLERAKRQKVEMSPESFSSRGSLPEKKICKHPGFVKELCIACGQRVDADSGTVPLTYIKKDITMSIAKDEMAQVRDKDLKNLLCRGKKLYLVLDLDHTLLNSARLTDIEEKEEAYLNSQRDDLPGTLKDSLIRLDEINMMTKLRPFVHTFLEEAHKLFEMYIYTMADREYAEKMAKLLDPKGEYFQSRIISRDDGTQKDQKGLDIFLEEESTVIIFDDTKEVWKAANTDNLILSDRYHFFASSCKNFGVRWDSLSQRNTDESETEGTLATVLKVLQQIHSLFFDEGRVDEDRDVRRVIKDLRKDVLKGCKIAFSRIYSKKSTPQHDPLWIMAEELGATCWPDVDSSVTHVVTRDAGTEKSKRAVSMNKFLVNRRWIETSYYLWRRQPEDQFLLTPANKR